MKTLSLNTSTRQYSIAIMDDEVLLGEYILPSNLTHYKGLMPAIDELFKKVNVSPSMIGGLIVAIGPGSFTGIRIGLSIVKGLSEYLQVPIVGVSTLEAMAHQIPFIKEDICPFVSSRKGEVFTGLFRWTSKDELLEIKQSVCLKIEDIDSIIEKTTVLIGNDYPDQATTLRQQGNELYILAPAYMWNLRSSVIAAVGLKKIKRGNPAGVNNIEPLYMRGADIRTPKKHTYNR